jgi:hypothetical protein
MKKYQALHTGRFLVFAALCGALPAPALLAQSTPSTQPSQTQQSQPSQDTGVSHPPPDSTIEADEDMNQPATPAPAPLPKPSAAVPVTSAPPPVAAAPAPVAPPPAATPAPSRADSRFAGEVDNTDMGIVTVVQANDTSAPPLQARPASADYGIVSDVPYSPYDLREGTNITVRLNQKLSTNDTQPGTPFTASVLKDVYSDGKVIIPAGSEMRGRVTSVSQGHHLGPHATIRLHPDVVVLPDGTAYHLSAEVVETDAPGTRADDEGGIQASNHYKKDAVEEGAAAGAGAVAGGAIAGPVGAGVGTLVGAGAATTHLLLQDPHAATLPEGTLLIFTLTEAMGLTPTKN